jgi:hypothetical protein
MGRENRLGSILFDQAEEPTPPRFIDIVVALGLGGVRYVERIVCK